MVHFWFCLKDGYENFEELRMHLSKCHLSSSVPPTTTESSEQSQCNILVFSKMESSHYLVWGIIDVFVLIVLP